jgi:hypothetical protein
MNAKCGLIALRWTLGIVVLIEAVMFILPGAAHDFARSHMPAFVRMVVGGGEIAGSILMLIPKTKISGAWLLMAVFVMAILIHLLHGMYNVGSLAVYTAAAFAVAVGKS